MDSRSSLGHPLSTSQHSPAGQTAFFPTFPVFNTPLAAESHSDATSSFPAVHCSPSSVEEPLPHPAIFSPPTDMDTDVSAIVDQAADNSDLWKSDVSFEV